MWMNDMGKSRKTLVKKVCEERAEWAPYDALPGHESLKEKRDASKPIHS